MQRLRAFLQPKSADAAQRAGEAIRRGVALFGERPHVGRPIDNAGTEMRERLIEFGSSGYVALYRVDGASVTVLAIRHQKEVGY